jgi:hypothetical protein
MLSPGEAEPDSPVRSAVEVRPPTVFEDRLTTVVSDITKLASAMGALSIHSNREEPTFRERLWGRSGGGPEHRSLVGDSDAARSANSSLRTRGLGATGTVTSEIGGYANRPVASADGQRQSASHYRM